MTETILLTGISGFLAKHIALRLLNAGYAVRGTLRSPDRAAEVRAALAPQLADAAAPDRLTFVPADLTADAGWAEAAAGVTAVVHTASPFPIIQPPEAEAGRLIRPAVDGTRRVLEAAAAAGVRRVVLTSSTAAILSMSRGRVQTEDDWADDSGPGTSPYQRSKTLAERTAWDIARARGLALTAINPGFIIGPPLDRHFGSSVGVIRRILKGGDPMMPALAFPMVDVRDAAEMHLRALQRPETAGKRYLAVSGTMWLAEMGRVLKAAHPTRRIPTRTAPGFAIRLLSLFDREMRAALPSLGHLPQVSNARALAEMEMAFIAPDRSLREMADWMLRTGVVA
jgi:dihydroflavonol-4-reductase